MKTLYLIAAVTAAAVLGGCTVYQPGYAVATPAPSVAYVTPGATTTYVQPAYVVR